MVDKNKNSYTEQYDVIVIGGGASGMMAAGIAASKGKKVLVLEKNNKLGKKLKISGGGRCNITNAEKNPRKFLSQYGEAEQFLFSPYTQFESKDTFKFFEEKGLPLIVQTHGRAFPKTEKALDVVRILETNLKKEHVKVLSNTKVTSLESSDNLITGVKSVGKIFTARSYILATGGLSHPETGSTGDGFKWLSSLGHIVEKPTPTLVPIAVEDSWIKSLAGKSFPSMKITFYLDGVKQFSNKDRLLCTHFGLSGPVILNSSKAVGELLYTAGVVSAKIDIFPDLDLGTLEKKIIELFDANKNKMLKNIFTEITPPGTAHGLLSILKDIDTSTKIHSITKDQRKRLVRLLKELPVTITSLMGYDRAVVADGGILLSEIDTKTMRSKKYNNLFITGDLLHINRPTGGFSLQLCWTTGYVAGINA